MIKSGKYRNIDWVICAAGSGSRFSKKGITTPKVKINLLGKTFLEWSLDSIDFFPGDRIILITQKKHNLKNLYKKIAKQYPWLDFKLIELTKPTTGQLSTFLHSKEFLRKTASVVIWNCDTYFKSIQLNQLIRSNEVDAVVPCGVLPGSHWSFFKNNSAGHVIEVKEKKRISKWCSVGFYHFKSSNKIIKIAEKIIKNDPDSSLKEHYVSSLYPFLISKGMKILNCPVEVFLPFGTPEEVKKHWNTNFKKLLNDNIAK